MSTLQKALVISAVIVLSGCVSVVREQPPRLTCEGPIGPTTSREDLVARFGLTEVVDEEIEIGEGESVEGTTVYPDDPSRRIEITWKNPARKNGVATLRVSEPSEWAVEGLANGQGLDSVERVNARTFSLYGFEWDYAGTVASWNGGTLDFGGGCRLLARFRPPGDDSEISLSGEELFSSDDERMRRLNPSVYELLLDFD